MPNNAIATRGFAIPTSPAKAAIGHWPAPTNFNVLLRSANTFLANAISVTDFKKPGAQISYLDMVEYWALGFQLHMHIPTNKERELLNSDAYFEMLDIK